MDNNKRPVASKIVLNIAALLFGVGLLLAIEFSGRFVLKIFFPKVYFQLTQYMDWSNPKDYIYVGHPFLQFTGKPNSVSGYGRFNNFGFTGRDFYYDKKVNTIRIATLGESTTADGYPEIMEMRLKLLVAHTGKEVEVFNFGTGWYTTAHSVINLILNVIDFSPDYLVIMHAWNENKVQCYPDRFRNDYSHVFTPYHRSIVWDRFFISNSMVYCLLKMQRDKRPSYWFVDDAVMLPDAWDHYYPNIYDLKPYIRNIRTMLDLAILRNIRPVLVTQPHSENPNITQGQAIEHIKRCNVLLRQLAQEYGEKIVFVDLDKEMTGKREDIFFDVGHMMKPGVDYKAEFIGKAIAGDIEKSEISKK